MHVPCIRNSHTIVNCYTTLKPICIIDRRKQCHAYCNASAPVWCENDSLQMACQKYQRICLWTLRVCCDKGILSHINTYTLGFIWLLCRNFFVQFKPKIFATPRHTYGSHHDFPRHCGYSDEWHKVTAQKTAHSHTQALLKTLSHATQLKAIRKCSPLKYGFRYRSQWYGIRRKAKSRLNFLWALTNIRYRHSKVIPRRIYKQYIRRMTTHRSSSRGAR